MVHILVAKDLQRQKVQKRGIISVPGEMAKYKCAGVRIQDMPLPHRHLQQVLHEAAKQMIAKQALRGYDYFDHDGVHVYGPYPSYEFREHMLTGEEYALRDGSNPKLAAQLVKERATVIGAYADYLIVANFWAVPQIVEYEVPSKEE